MTKAKFEPPQCVGCGYCCCKVWCYPALQKYGFGKLSKLYETKGVCPELRWTGKVYRCELAGKSVRNDTALSIGEGCCSTMNSDRKNIPSPKERGRKVKRKESHDKRSAKRR